MLVLGALMALSTSADYGFKREERSAAGDLAEKIARIYIRANPPGERSA
jgi:hypothetical protein